MAKVPKPVWDLLFTLVLPIAVLSPNLLGSGINIARDLFGGGAGGNVRAYLLAALIPVMYVAADLLIHRAVSALALLGGAVALARGALAFWYADGPAYALKDSVPALLFGLLALGSLLGKTPLFHLLFDLGSVAETPEHRAATQEALRQPQLRVALRQATALYGLSELLSALLHYLLNLRIVTAQFGSDAFNVQVAESHAALRLPALILSLLAVGAGFWLLQRASRARYGVSLLSGEQLLAAQERERN